MPSPSPLLFPSRLAIGKTDPSGAVYMTPDFARALELLLTRIGGPIGPASDDLELAAALQTPLLPVLGQANTVADLELAAALQTTPGPSSTQPLADLELAAASVGAYFALTSQLAQLVQDVQLQIVELGKELARVSELRKSVDDLQLATLEVRTPTDWERPGKIGAVTPNTGAFTGLTATTYNKVTITAPAGSATLTLATGKALTANSSLTLAGVDGKTLTVNNTLGFSGTDGATVNVGAGGTLGPAAYAGVNAYIPAGGAGWDIRVGAFGCNGQNPTPKQVSGGTLTGVINALIAFGILSS